MPQPKRIREIEYGRIDRVEDGAQPGAHIPLVKARVRIEKLIDPNSVDAKMQLVRDAFRAAHPSDSGKYEYVDAIYSSFVIVCDNDGTYSRYDYTANDDTIAWGESKPVTPSVSWESGDDETATLMAKSKKLWEASTADRIARNAITKEQTMPKPKTLEDLDLSKLDEDAKALIESAFTERDEATAEADKLAADKKTFDDAVAAAEAEPADEDDVDMTTVEGIAKAIKKTRSPEMKSVLTAAKVALEKANAQNEEIVTLRKAERARVYIAKAKTVPHLAVHAAIAKSAGGEEVDGVTALSGLLDTVAAKCGDETCDAVVAMLAKAQTQLREAVGPLLKSVGAVGGDEDGQAEILDTGGNDVEAANAEIETRATELRKANEKMTPAQARRKVMQDDPELRKKAQKKTA